MSKEKKEHLRQRLAIHAHLAETIRCDQLKRARPGSHVKKFRHQATQFKQAAIFIDRFDTLHPGWPRRGSPPSPSWQIVEPEGLGILASTTAYYLGNILTRKFCILDLKKPAIGPRHLA